MLLTHKTDWRSRLNSGTATVLADGAPLKSECRLSPTGPHWSLQIPSTNSTRRDTRHSIDILYCISISLLSCPSSSCSSCSNFANPQVPRSRSYQHIAETLVKHYAGILPLKRFSKLFLFVFVETGLLGDIAGKRLPATTISYRLPATFYSILLVPKPFSILGTLPFDINHCFRLLKTSEPRLFFQRSISLIDQRRTSTMPFREKLKKAFKSNSATSSKTNSPVIEQSPDIATWPSNVYKPGEPMPRPKYRAPVKKEHKDKLDAFNFGSAWKRRSQQSIYSPMGSRVPSRRGSAATRPSLSSKRPSLSASRRSISAQSGITANNTEANRLVPSVRDDENEALSTRDPSRNNSVGGAGGGEKRFKDPHGAARPTRLSTEVEQEGDDDVTNGMSRHSRRKTSIVTFNLPDYTINKHNGPKVNIPSLLPPFCLHPIRP